MTDEAKNPVGRPRKYQSPEDMEVAINEYFGGAYRDYAQVPTVSGLALHLGFCNRQGMLLYDGYTEEFSYLIKKAITRVETRVEAGITAGEPNQAGRIFWLKNHGWRDTQEYTGPDGGPIPMNVTLSSTVLKDGDPRIQSDTD